MCNGQPRLEHRITAASGHTARAGGSTRQDDTMAIHPQLPGMMQSHSMQYYSVPRYLGHWSATCNETALQNLLELFTTH